MGTRIETERLVMRPFTPDDVPELAKLLAHPEVRHWWPSPIDAATLLDEFDGHLTILRDDRVIGILECWEEDDPNYPSVAFDIALAADQHDQGLGPEALRGGVKHFIAKGHHRFTIDPNVGNQRAIEAYSKVGFKPIGIARRSEKMLDGLWADALMMDLLAEELE